MTTLLQEVFQKASVLPKSVQETLAKEFLMEISWEEKWDKTLENSQSTLEDLTLKAMQEYKEGKTYKMGFDQL